MTQELWFGPGGERVQAAFDEALAWCERFSVVTDGASASEKTDALWARVSNRAERLGAAVFFRPEAADGELIRPFQSAGRLRRLGEDVGLPGHLAWFEKGDELRVLLASGGLQEHALAGPAIWVYWQGERSAMPPGLQQALEGCLASSAPIAPDEVLAGPRAASALPVYSRPILSVREVLLIRSIVDFFDLETEQQELALWSALFGEGAVDLEQAIRLAAVRLRAQGFLEYQALRQDGRIHTAIEERLIAARRSTSLFDRPRNGFIRAIEPNLERLSAEQWRDCLMNALTIGVRVDRDEAVRLGFNYAQAVYGIEAQRLRGGGRADQALRSAINSAIRQGYLERDGAVYLIRIAKSAPPTLRGVIATRAESEAPEPEAPESEAPTPTSETPASVEPAPAVSESAPAVSGSAPAVSESAPAVPEPAPLTAEAAAEVTEPSAVEPGPESPLDRKLDQLDFPTRTLNWALRREVETVRELVKWDPQAFAVERNVGRRTVRETRELLESLLKCTWEEARASLIAGTEPPLDAEQTDDEHVDSATEALTAGGPVGWSRLGASLSDEERAAPLSDVQLPTRIKNFVRAQGISTLGELFGRPYAELVQQQNLGRKSLNDTLDAVRDHLSERNAPPAHATFLAAWHAQLAALEPIPRMIVTRRAGMHGTREKLEEIGAMLGVTRERVRQIEARVIERLRERSRWRRAFEQNLAAAFGHGRAIPLGLLAQEPWWAGIDREELLVDYVVRRIFEGELFLLEGPSGKRYLTKFPLEEFSEHLEIAKERLAKLEYPVERQAVEAILHSESEALDPILYGELELAAAELIHYDPENPGRVLGYGAYRQHEVIAFLNGQSAPVPVSLVEERCGRGALPDEVLYFKRGVVGLKRHFPDFDLWMERLVPAALDVMQERPAGRQWLVPEIHDALKERGLVPDWLGHWHLASLLRLSGRVNYLGRLRVATLDSGQEERLQYADLLEEVLEQSGGPLHFEELLARARVHTDISETTATLLVKEAPFVRVDEQRVGLLERDVPGGPEAVAAAIDAVVQTLTETEHGLTPHQATELVHRLSDVHATWSQQLVTSILRNESRLRIDRSRNIGLDEWDDVRCPARPEFVRREVAKAGGSLAVQDLSASMEAVYGRAPDRAQLAALAAQVGLVLSGDVISHPPTVVPEAAPASRPGINLSGIPVELRQMFEDLVREPLSDVLDLRRQINEHVEAIEAEYRVNEFVDREGAHVLSRQCHELLDRWDSLPPADRHVVHAAVRYFVSWHDVEHDLDLGGLDDDKKILGAVLEYLGLSREVNGALAS